MTTGNFFSYNQQRAGLSQFPRLRDLLRRTINLSKTKDPTRTMAIDLARLADDDNSEDVVVLDLRGRSPVTDYYVIVTGGSDRQRRTVADDAVKLARERQQPVLGVSGLEQPDWVLVDLVDVVVHIFDRETRGYYDLEMLWGDAPKIRWKRPARKANSKPAL